MRAPADVFTASVRPVLLRHCSPCHEPGGQLYDRLPFNDPSTVLGVQAGVLRRLKDDDRRVLAEWFASQDAPAAIAR